jgi:hypothetical protein
VFITRAGCYVVRPRSRKRSYFDARESCSFIEELFFGETCDQKRIAASPLAKSVARNCPFPSPGNGPVRRNGRN